MKKFKGTNWINEINVKDFINNNYREYKGDDSFLVGPTERTLSLWEICKKMLKEEIDKGVLDIDVENLSGVNNFAPGYIDKDKETIVGLQTDAPLKRIVNPYGGIRLVHSILKTYGYEMKEGVLDHFNGNIKTHNQGVFDAYTPEIRKARSSGLLTGLPDAYGRGRIIGDYRRVALYGVDRLIEVKENDLKNIRANNENNIRLREEVRDQINALNDLKSMAKSYGFDISKPAETAVEAVQWTYFAYLASIKENNGAAMSLGRISTFLDIYIERDIEEGLISEVDAQEMIDHLIMKLRLVRHLRTPEYDKLFAGDPTWVTESIGGMLDDKKSLVTKTSFRFLHSLTNLGPAPEPNMTVLWSNNLPSNFKKYCAKLSIETGALQYENDDIMRPLYGSDYGIACCVSAMKIGEQMQYFGARVNLAKALLYSLNGGIDEITLKTSLDGVEKLEYDNTLNYEELRAAYSKVLKKVAKIYVEAMNTIHYMHDKYAYESSQLALHNTNVERLMAFGIAGLSVVADSLSAVKYASVYPIRDKSGIVIDFKTVGDYPKYGNDDDRVDSIAIEVIEEFYGYLKEHELIRDAKHTLSILTITSNVVYGKKTGSTPDGRKGGEAFAPGANPMHGRDSSGALASLNSVAKIPFQSCRDGISNTFSVIPDVLGKGEDERVNNLAMILDGYFAQKAHHLNVNVLNKEKLIDAMENPENYPQLTIRVSGYAVNFVRLSKEQQEEVISRTFHSSM